jgi:pimeloyl-ACP methyl ester carboxylesterase
MWNLARPTATAFVLVALIFGCPAPSAAQSSPQPPDAFITVNGVRLHYFDWGGQGETLLLLTALGGTGHGFDSFAPRFTDRFHVVVLTRRGQGLSDKPPSGYDLDTLATDIRAFMDALHINRAHLAGHSIAGAEMTRFAINYPERLLKLVYLDASADFALINALINEAHVVAVEDKVLAEILTAAGAVHPDYSKIRAPALAFFTVIDPLPILPTDSPEVKRYTQLLNERKVMDSQIEQFRTGVKDGRVILLRDANHATFLSDEKYAPDVAREMRAFLLP